MPTPRFVRHSLGTDACLIASMLALPGIAMAQTEGPVTARATLTSQSDSNIFRQPTALSEQITSTVLGLGFNTKQGLQSFNANVSFVDNKYQNFNYLNYTATNYDAAWQYAITPKLHGNITSSYQETLNNYTDTRNVSARILNINRVSRIDAIYEIDGPWSISTGVTQTLQNNQRDQVQGSDFTSTASEVGVAYAFGSGSRASFTTRTSSGQYLDQPVIPGSIFDNSFNQTDNELRLRWAVTGSNTVDLYTTGRSVTHPNVALRNFSGTTAGASTNWLLSGKTSLNAAWSRDVGAYQAVDANYSQTDALALSANWQAFSKVGLTLRHDVSHVTYLGGPIPSLQSKRQDDLTNTTLALTWVPDRHYTVTASVQSAARTSNSPGSDYSSTLTALSATLSF